MLDIKRFPTGAAAIGVLAASFAYVEANVVSLPETVPTVAVVQLVPIAIVMLTGWAITGRPLWFIKEADEPS